MSLFDVDDIGVYRAVAEAADHMRVVLGYHFPTYLCPINIMDAGAPNRMGCLECVCLCSWCSDFHEILPRITKGLCPPSPKSEAVGRRGLGSVDSGHGMRNVVWWVQQ